MQVISRSLFAYDVGEPPREPRNEKSCSIGTKTSHRRVDAASLAITDREKRLKNPT